MKSSAPASLLLIVLLTACAPQSVTTPSPIPAVINTPDPTRTVEPASTLIPPSKISLDSCTQILEAKISSVGVLEVIYAGGAPPQNVLSRFGMAEYTELWMWSDDTQAVVHFSLPQDALGPKLSPDHQWIVFRRDPTATQSELWVIDASGQNEKRLAAIPFDDSSGLDAILEYDWVPGTNKIYYFITLIGGDGATPDTFIMVDIDSGQALPLAESIEASKVIFSPDGSQAAVLTASELRLVDTKDGHVQFKLPMTLSSYGVERSSTPAFSPDGKYLIDFTQNGIVSVNAATGQSQIIALKYSVIVPAGGDSPTSLSPDFTWAGGSMLLLPILNSDQQHVVLSPEGDPNMTFTVWQVDLNSGAAHQTQTFTGYQPSVVFSPDGRRLALQVLRAGTSNQTNDLYIAALNTGQILETVTDGQFETWRPDSNQFIYSTGHPIAKSDTGNVRYSLGRVGGEPMPLDWSVFDSIAWLNAEWIAADCQLIHMVP